MNLTVLRMHFITLIFLADLYFLSDARERAPCNSARPSLDRYARVISSASFGASTRWKYQDQPSFAAPAREVVGNRGLSICGKELGRELLSETLRINDNMLNHWYRSQNDAKPHRRAILRYMSCGYSIPKSRTALNEILRPFGHNISLMRW